MALGHSPVPVQGTRQPGAPFVLLQFSKLAAELSHCPFLPGPCRLVG